jgi:hypothetical protein
MSLIVPYTAGFQKILNGPAAARIASAYGGTATSVSANTKTAYTQLISGASLTDDAYGIFINFNNGFFAAESRSTICDIGLDPAGGTSYTAVIANLIASNAGTICADREANGGYSYFFPLFIKAGSSVGFNMSVNHATARAIRCYAKFYCQPKRPDAVNVGTFVETIGAVAASSSGTVVTGGGASEGAWTSLGTTAKRTWYHQLGHSTDQVITSNLGYFSDLSAGVSGGELLLLEDVVCRVNNNDDSEGQELYIPFGGEVVAGATIWGRSQCSGTAETMSMAAYCLGG